MIASSQTRTSSTIRASGQSENREQFLNHPLESEQVSAVRTVSNTDSISSTSIVSSTKRRKQQNPRKQSGDMIGSNELSSEPSEGKLFASLESES